MRPARQGSQPHEGRDPPQSTGRTGPCSAGAGSGVGRMHATRGPGVHHPHLQPVRTDSAAALELRSSIVATRARLADVLHARATTLAAATSWVGPHRRRYEQDAADLLDAGRVLDGVLADLLTALDAEIEAAHP